MAAERHLSLSSCIVVTRLEMRSLISQPVSKSVSPPLPLFEKHLKMVRGSLLSDRCFKYILGGRESGGWVTGRCSVTCHQRG